jgi:hypothetical protein
MGIEDKKLKNQELTRLIGRRLKEAIGGAGSGLPAAIDEGLAALRRAEARLAGSVDPVVDIGNGAVGASGGATVDESSGSEPHDAGR